MKTELKIICVSFVLILVVTLIGVFIINNNQEMKLKSIKSKLPAGTTKVVLENIEINKGVETSIVYDNMTFDELSDKLNRSLKSKLSGTGNLFAKYSLEKGVDPYLAVAIVLHETGCNWNCSTLVTSCNNVGGMKGSPSCGNGSYKAFATLEEGIKAYIDNLYNNYYAYGLNTPELINPKYAALSLDFAFNVLTLILSRKSSVSFEAKAGALADTISL